jgi:hypothetical protein
VRYFSKNTVVCFLFLMLPAGIGMTGCTVQKRHPIERKYIIAPTILPGTRAEMKTAGYWIGRHPDPDRLLMNPAEIDSLNAHIRDKLKTVEDIAAYPVHIDGKSLQLKLDRVRRNLAKQGLWRKDGSAADIAFFESVKNNLDLHSIAEDVTVRYAMVTEYADQRILPTNEILSSTRGDSSFDKLQNSAYDIGTPLAIVHASADGEWFYTAAPLSSGWMSADKLAFCSREDLLRYTGALERAVVTRAKADIYHDGALHKYHTRARLGASLPVLPNLTHLPDNAISVLVPLREEDGVCRFTALYLSKAEAHVGALPLTPRSLIRSAFMLLNEPYGWGGMHGEQDCSQFIQQIFAVHGLLLPRNSNAQSQVGTRLDLAQETPDAEKETLLANEGVGGSTLLEMRGHIMLYLGSIDGKPYVIHNIWGYLESGDGNGDTMRIINGVAVTDLELGRGSERGALISRVRSARTIP